MREIATVIGGVAIGLWAGAALSQSQPVVVELYTSQGCSSCPPADALLTKLAMRDDVLALALHVDYWDYIGWKDTFADPNFTARQKAYARAAGHRSIYTPQMIVAGADHVVGFQPMQVMDLINDSGARAPKVTIRLAQRANVLTIQATAAAQDLPPAMDVELVRFDPRRDVSIRRGENAGQTIIYSNVVTLWKQIGDWDGRAPLKLSYDLGTGGGKVAVIVQAAGNGPIVAAAQLP